MLSLLILLLSGVSLGWEGEQGDGCRCRGLQDSGVRLRRPRSAERLGGGICCLGLGWGRGVESAEEGGYSYVGGAKCVGAAAHEEDANCEVGC